MAEEIFRQDGYMFEFEAVVTSVSGDGVTLSETAFYPGGGGQVCDTGTIRGLKVTEAFYEGDEIVHIVPGNDLKVGDRIWCSVDWDRRYDLMKGHTGEHLLFCSLKAQATNLQIRKIFISPDSKYVVVDQDMDWEAIGEAIRFANDRIKDNLSITKAIMSRDDPGLEDVRMNLERIDSDEISVVSIGDIDHSACSGLHLMETGEIGMIIVERKASLGKDGVAIHFKVGDDAKEFALGRSMLSHQMIDAMDSKPEDALKTLRNLKSDSARSSDAVERLVKTIMESAKPTRVRDVDVFGFALPDVKRNSITDHLDVLKGRGVAYFLMEGGTVMVLGGNGISASKVLSRVIKEFNGKGGGRDDFAQGSVPNGIDFDLLRNSIEDAISHQ